MKHLPQRTQAGAAETNFRKRSSDSQFSVLSWVPQLGEKLQSMNSGTAPGEKQNTGDFGVILLRVWKMALLYWSFKHLNDDAALFLYINFKWLNTFPKYDFLLTISFFFPFSYLRSHTDLWDELLAGSQKVESAGLGKCFEFYCLLCSNFGWGIVMISTILNFCMEFYYLQQYLQIHYPM